MSCEANRIVNDDGAHRAAERLDTRERTEAELRLSNERLALLSEAAAHLLKAENPDTMVLELFKKVSDHLDVHAYFNFMINETGDALRLDSCAGIPNEVAHRIERLEFGQAVCGTVAMLRHAIYATDIQNSDDEKVQLVKGFGIRAYACNPLMAGDRLIGTLSFASRTKDRFDEGELEFMRTICHYVAMAKERLRMETELRRHIDQLAEADRRKDEFLAMLSHEMRNPLAPIRNAVEVLKLAGDSLATRHRQWEIIDRQVKHMAHLLDDLLDVSRITRGKIELHRQPLQLTDVLVHAVEIASPLIEKQGHTLKIAAHPAPLWVYGDRDRLAQVIGNLLCNAAKYTEHNGRIWLEASHEGTAAVIHVRDNGTGISSEVLPHIFDLFTQAERTLDRSQGGLGIGLTMVRKLVQMHDGTVEATSAGPGQGSEFTVRLPLLMSTAEMPSTPPAGALEHGASSPRRWSRP